MNKKGQFSEFNLFTLIIFAFLVVMVFAGWIYVSGLLNNVFQDVGLNNEQNSAQPTFVNLTVVGQQIWGQNYQAIQSLRMVSIVYILALGACIIIIGHFQKKHPFLFFIYILIVILAIIFAVPISNAYEEILSSGVFAGELSNFTASNFILLNLPTFIMVVGILGAILLFISLVRGGGEGEIS